MHTKDKRIQGKHLILISPGLNASEENIDGLKKVFFQLILKHERHLEHLGVAQKTNSDGLFYVYVYIQYIYRRTLSRKHFKYLPNGYPRVSVVRGINDALDYIYGEDRAPLLTKGFSSLYLINTIKIKRDLLAMLWSKMQKDALNFNVWQYITQNGLTTVFEKKCWQNAIFQLEAHQAIQADRALRGSTSLHYITRQLIQQSLTTHELQLYDSWEGYQKIVDHINQIALNKYLRPVSAKHLLLVGRKDISTKIANEIRKYVAVFNFRLKKRFPYYENDVYSMILFNQFYLNRMSYKKLLTILNVDRARLTYGCENVKIDNPLIYITSNKSLEQHICDKFKDENTRTQARYNLRLRITQVVIPSDKDLSLLLKLIRGKPEADDLIK